MATNSNVKGIAPSVRSPTGIEYQWDIFLAHAGPDGDIADRLYDKLAGRCRVFLDSRSLQLGDDWDLELAKAQRHSRVSVVVVSPDTGSAYYQREEIAAAIALARVEAHRVIPLFVRGAGPASNDVPYGLRLKHGLTVSNRGVPEAADRIAQLIADLKNQATSSGPIMLPPPGGAAGKRMLLTAIALVVMLGLGFVSFELWKSHTPTATASTADPPADTSRKICDLSLSDASLGMLIDHGLKAQVKLSFANDEADQQSAVAIVRQTADCVRRFQGAGYATQQSRQWLEDASAVLAEKR
jgi:hypothetical protein